MVSNNSLLDQSEATATATATATSRSCFNALLHGAASEKTYIPGEDPAEREALMEDALNQYKPCSLTDSALVANYVNSLWILARRQRSLFLQDHASATATFDSPRAVVDYQAYVLLDRYKTGAERSVQRNLANLRAIRKDQFTEEKSREQRAIVREKLALERAKFEQMAKPKQAEESASEMFERIQEAHAVLAARAERVPDLNAHPIQFDEENEQWIIEQSANIAINEEGKACIWEIEPSHAKVRELIDCRTQLENEPVEVVRHFLFTDGLPKEYQFLVDEYGAEIPRGKKNFELILGFDFDEYLKLAAMEDQLPEYLEPEELEEAA